MNNPDPFARSGDYTLYHGDAVEILNQLPRESADLIFADPPYNLSNDGTTCHSGKRVPVNKGDWDKSAGIEADFEFHTRWIEACRGVLKPDGTIWISGTYHSVFSCGFALQRGGWHILNDIAWYKPNAAPNLACRMFAASHETLIWARKSKDAKHYFNYAELKATKFEGDIFKKEDRQARSVWCIPTPGSGEKKYGKHPAQKPLALLDRIILAACPPQGLVADPFCGSGTTGAAALKRGAKFIGIDNSRDYLEKLALPRLEEVVRKDRG
ncbi:MAG: site-specific DNA-methyltransferase [Desulfovibrio sp.]|nr:site-specific DNA-methyltransferase [Desulfovibrio sp.]